MKKTTVLCLIFLLTAAMMQAAAQKVDLKATLLEKQVQDLTAEGLSLVFYVRFDNGSGRAYYISGYQYRFVVAEQEYLNLNQDLAQGIRVDPGQSTTIALPVKITYDYLFRTVQGVSDRSTLSCYLSGGFTISDGRKDRGRLPVAFSAEFPVFRPVEVSLLPLKINALTIGGADLVFSVRFANPNAFEFVVNRLTYAIKIGGRKVDEGTVGGNKNIPAGGSKVFELPLLLNFFEVGKEIYALLQQEAVNGSIAGEMEIETTAEILTLPFDSSKRVTIEKGGQI
jgi:LEA14-like dessication related protein